MNGNTRLALVGMAIVLAGGGWWFTQANRGGSEGDITFRFAPVEEGELLRSIQATGQLVALTSVDIRSKAGGRVDAILVEEGDVVTEGQLLARIDPSDTRAVVEQAEADVTAAKARADLAKVNLSLEERQRRNAVLDAEKSVEISRVRLDRAQTNARSQPELTTAATRQARAALAAEEQSLIQLQSVEVPQLRADASANRDRAEADVNAARADHERQTALYQQDFISKAALDRSQATLAANEAAFQTAKQRAATIEQQIESRVKQQRSRVDQAEASLRTALANSSRDTVAQKDLLEARAQLEAAQLNLEEARNALMGVQARAAESRSAQASTVRSRVSLENAQVQLDSTTVLSPRAGVVTKKYLEAGTIIPPGTSTFAQGTAILQVSDTTRMFVECLVDEADIAAVRVGQSVRVILEAFPGERLKGRVTRINPAAETNQNITAIRVRVEIEADPKVDIKVGMNATCEFLTLEKPNALIVPQQAVEREEGKAFVRIKGPNGKPQRVEVKLGEQGNEGFEVLSGLTKGQEVVVAEINLAQMREIEARMREAQQGGGLAGANRGPGSRTFGPGGAGGAGGAGGGGQRGGGGGGGPR